MAYDSHKVNFISFLKEGEYNPAFFSQGSGFPRGFPSWHLTRVNLTSSTVREDWQAVDPQNVVLKISCNKHAISQISKNQQMWLTPSGLSDSWSKYNQIFAMYVRLYLRWKEMKWDGQNNKIFISNFLLKLPPHSESFSVFPREILQFLNFFFNDETSSSDLFSSWAFFHSFLRGGVNYFS